MIDDPEERIKKVKEVFEKAKIFERDKKGNFKEDKSLRYEDTFRNAVRHAVVVCGKDYLSEFDTEIIKYIDHPDDQIQLEVLTVLGFRFKSPLLKKEKLYEIFMNTKKDPLVRDAALELWARLFVGTCNKEVLNLLYDALIYEEEYFIKTTAYYYILYVCGVPSEKIHGLSATSDIDKIHKRMDWDYIHELMRKYSPETDLIDPSQFEPRAPRKVER